MNMSQNPNNSTNQSFYNPSSQHTYFEVLIQQLMQENQVLKYQLQTASVQATQQYEKAEAFSELRNRGHGYVASDEHGYFHTLLDIAIDCVYYIRFDPLFNLCPRYMITMSKSPERIILTEKEFNQPKTLLNEIARVSGHNPRQLKSGSTASNLIRSYIASKAVTLDLPFYQGWLKDTEGRWKYRLNTTTTHGSCSINPSHTVQNEFTSVNIPLSSGLNAAEQFVQLMDTIATPCIRSIVCLWFHTAALTSLLTGLGYRVPMGLCLYSTEPRVIRHLEKIFSWYDDSIIPMALEKSSFLKCILERKDQPALFRDTSDYSENAKILERAFLTGEIPLDKGFHSNSSPLMGLPTVLSDATSLLSISPHIATVEIDCSDLQSCTGESLSALCQYTFEYVLYFNAWVELHTDILQNYLSNGIDTVTMDHGEHYQGLNESGITTLGILFGIRRIVQDFYKAIGANEKMFEYIQDMLHPKHANTFLAALHNAVDCYGSSDELASLFLDTISAMRSRDEFDWRSATDANLDVPCPDGKAGIVYENDEYIGFTRNAFLGICNKCGVSSPHLLQALHKAELRECPVASKASKQNRMTVYNADGRSERVYVYKFDCNSLTL